MKFKLLLTILFTALSFSANAALSLEAGIFNWQHEPSGNFTNNSGGVGTAADLANDLNLKEEKENSIYAVFRHFVPLVPNVRLMTTALSNKGSGTVSSTFDFGGTPYNIGTAVTTELTLDQTDITLFWNILDTGLTFDIGLTAKMLDGVASVDDGSGAQSVNIDGTITMLYANVEISPIDALTLSATANALSIDDNEISDYILKARYNIGNTLGLEAGHRKQSIKLDDLDSTSGSMDFSGPFIGLNVKF